MSPTEYSQAMRGIELAAEYHAVQARLDAGHEFAALMEPGSQVLLAGEWRTIAEVRPAPDDRVILLDADGREWLANRTATRRYRPASTGEPTE